MRRRFICLAAGLAMVSASACNEQRAATLPSAPPPEVSVVALKEQPIPYVRELPGRVAPTRIAEVRSRVSGLVTKRLFEQGSVVHEGDILYKIDPAPYQVELLSTEAALAKAQAAATLAKQQADRLETLLSRNTASQAQYDAAYAAEKQAEAEVAGAQAARDRARLNLAWTDVRAPISGRIGRALLTEGTLIEQGATGVLATVQQLDPIYVDITQSVGELNKLRRDFASGELAKLSGDAANVHLIMDDGTLYGSAGRLLFSDVTADPSTGQVTLRVIIPNPHDELFPGMYVRARIKQGIDADGIAVPQQAVQRTDDGKPEVWVVKPDRHVMLQPIEVGPVVDGQWVVRSGLEPGQTVVVEGFQKIVAGMEVKPLAWKADGAAPDRPHDADANDPASDPVDPGKEAGKGAGKELGKEPTNASTADARPQKQER